MCRFNTLDGHTLFAMVRTAFSAGWQAAGDAAPKPERLFELLAASPLPGEKISR